MPRGEFEVRGLATLMCNGVYGARDTSRHASPDPEIVEMKHRGSPVIWHGVGPLNEEQQQFYAEKGYLLLRNVLSSALIETLRAEVDRLKEGDYVSIIRERDNKTVRSVFDAHNLNPMISDQVARNELLLDIAEQILGNGVYVHQCHVNFKRPGGGEFFWHSDFTFWFWEDGMPEPRAISLFVFLDPARTETGPLCVVPGSHQYITHPEWYRSVDDHKQAVRHDFESEAKRNGLVDRDTLLKLSQGKTIETIWGNPGDVLVMDGNLVHASGPNFGVDERRVLLLILNNLNNRIGTPNSGGRPRPEYISSRTFEALR